MIKLVIEKELREIISSTKFIITFSVCTVLILLTFYVGAKNHKLNLSRYEAAKAENFRQMEGLTDWLRVSNHRIFLPPQPLEALVSGVSNDIGRTINIHGRGELTSVDSRYNDDPIFAVFRFLDLTFIFQVVLSLFAILFVYDAINGEKERGTLQLSFAGPVQKDKFILAKVIGSFLSLSIPLLIPVLLGCLLLPILGINLSPDEWIRLALVIVTGLIYFGVFLTLSIFVSALTQRSSSSFLALLVIWIFAVFIIPRTSVLLAGRAVNVPSSDELSYKKSRFRAQLWQEDKKKIQDFASTEVEDMEKMASEFSKFMQDLSKERNDKMDEYADRLNEERKNYQTRQQRLAFNIARFSPSSLFSLAITNFAGTSLKMKQQFLKEANGYQQAYSQFMKEKTGMSLGGGIMIYRVGEGEDEKPIDPGELPEFNYKKSSLVEALNYAIIDIALLIIFNLLFFVGAYTAFIKYDVR